MSTRDKAAEALCLHDDTIFHHDRTDDFPCSDCKARADALADAGLLRDEKAEQALARVEALADEWAVEGSSLVDHAHGARDVHEGTTLGQCATSLRAALRGD